jgi:hypothetical protein
VDDNTTMCLPADGRNPAIAGGGRQVAFLSKLATLDSGCANGLDHVFVWQVDTGATTCVSRALDGEAGDQSSTTPGISADGRVVSFVSSADNLVPADTNALDDVFVKDLSTGQTTQASTDVLLVQGNGASRAAAMSEDGTSVAFETDATNLVYGDTLGLTDIVARSTRLPVLDAVTPGILARGTTTTVTITGLGLRSNSTPHAGSGITFGPVTFLSPSELLVDVTVDASAPIGSRTLYLWNPGAAWNASAGAAGSCACLTVT